MKIFIKFFQFYIHDHGHGPLTGWYLSWNFDFKNIFLFDLKWYLPYLILMLRLWFLRLKQVKKKIVIFN